MKIGDAIQRIQSLYSKGVDTDESRLSSRYIYNIYLTIRSRLMVQRLRKNQPLSEWDLQPLHCIEMIPQTALSCGPDYKCPFMKSKYPLPLAVTPSNIENVVVTSFDAQTIFSRTTFESFKYISGNKYANKKPYYYIHDSYLYLINSRMDKAHMHGIWRDPIEVWRLHMLYQNKSICFNNQDVEFFTPNDMIESIIEIAAKELQLFMSAEEDITNDSKDTLLQKTK